MKRRTLIYSLILILAFAVLRLYGAYRRERDDALEKATIAEQKSKDLNEEASRMQHQSDCNLLWIKYENARLEQHIAELEGRVAPYPVEPSCTGHAENLDEILSSSSRQLQVLSAAYDANTYAQFERRYAANRKYQTRYLAMRLWAFLLGTELKIQPAEMTREIENPKSLCGTGKLDAEVEVRICQPIATPQLAQQPQSPQQPKPNQPAPTIKGSVQQVTTISESVKEHVIQQSRSCPLTREWSVDFAGNGSPYRVEQRHCTNQQLSAFDLPKSDWTDLRAGYSFLLVLKPPLNQVVHGEFEEGSYSSVEPIKVQGREYVTVNGMVWGPSGDHYWCLLAQDKTGQLACWREQKGDLRDYLRRSLQPDERLTVSDSIAGKDGRVFIESYVEAEGDAQCCPSRGKIQVDLTPKDGVLYWSKVTRIACPGVATGTGTCSDSAAHTEAQLASALDACLEKNRVGLNPGTHGWSVMAEGCREATDPNYRGYSGAEAESSCPGGKPYTCDTDPASCQTVVMYGKKWLCPR
jgi:hypothetical protein